MNFKYNKINLVKLNSISPVISLIVLVSYKHKEYCFPKLDPEITYQELFDNVISSMRFMPDNPNDITSSDLDYIKKERLVCT